MEDVRPRRWNIRGWEKQGAGSVFKGVGGGGDGMRTPGGRDGKAQCAGSTAKALMFKGVVDREGHCT